MNKGLTIDIMQEAMSFSFYYFQVHKHMELGTWLRLSDSCTLILDLSLAGSIMQGMTVE